MRGWAGARPAGRGGRLGPDSVPGREAAGAAESCKSRTAASWDRRGTARRRRDPAALVLTHAELGAGNWGAGLQGGRAWGGLALRDPRLQVHVLTSPELRLLSAKGCTFYAQSERPRGSPSPPAGGSPRLAPALEQAGGGEGATVASQSPSGSGWSGQPAVRGQAGASSRAERRSVRADLGSQAGGRAPNGQTERCIHTYTAL